MEALDTFIGSMLTIERWPFWSVALSFAIIGNFTAKRLFTRERAYLKRASQPFWWWGRESLPLHPMVAGALLGLFWKDPEGAGWSAMASCMYFVVAGIVSLGLWVVIKAIAKSRGVELTLPGESEPPPPATPD